MIVVENTELINLLEAYDFLKDRYKEYPWDIWFETLGSQQYIHIENVYDAIHYQARLTSLEEVKEFVETGGFDNSEKY